VTRLRAFLAALLLAFAFLSGASASAAPQFPKLTGRVVDDANIIPEAEEARITQKLAALEQQSGRQVVVVTLPDLQGYSIDDYGYQLGREWGIGQKGEDNGALLIVAPNERKVRIEVGYGLEPILTDAWSWFIVRDEILPRFKQGDMPAGIEAGVDAIVQQITLPPEEAQKVADQAKAAREDSNKGSGFGGFIFLLIIIFFFVIPLLSAIFGGGRRRRRRYGVGSAVGDIALWTALSALSDNDHGGGGWGGGGFGGGGGFSGGGGSFGGGGASGGW